MKAQKKTLWMFGLYLVVPFLMLISGCQKDEVIPVANPAGQTPTLNNSKSAIANFTNPEMPAPQLTDSKQTMAEFSASPLNLMMRIKHEAARTDKPDYMVALYTDGSVAFEGVRNVSHIGTFYYRIPKASLDAFNETMREVNFYAIADINEVIMDVPMISTTFQGAGSDPKTLIDYDNGYPATLIALREKVESLLNVSRFIKPTVANTPEDVEPGKN